MAMHDGVPAGEYNRVYGATAVQNMHTTLVSELLPLSGATAL